MYLLIALAITALVIYLSWRGLGTAESQSPPATPMKRPIRRESRPTAPDDDPEFLREIDRRLRGEDKNGSGGPTSSA